MKEILNMIKSIDIKIKKVMKYGFYFCFVLALISCIVLITYKFFYISPTIYYIGIYLLKDSILFACAFFSFGIGFNKMKDDLI